MLFAYYYCYSNFDTINTVFQSVEGEPHEKAVDLLKAASGKSVEKY